MLNPEAELRRLAKEAQREAKKLEERAQKAEQLLHKTARKLDAVFDLLRLRGVITPEDFEAIHRRFR